MKEKKELENKLNLLLDRFLGYVYIHVYLKQLGIQIRNTIFLRTH